MKKKILFLTSVTLCVLSLLIFLPVKLDPVCASFESDISHKAYVLVERNTNKILLEDNSHEHLQIASVTKLMTTLLTLEKIKSGEISIDDNVRVSENASGMGGSQVFLDANADYKLGELLKSVIIASANDSSVALAEYIAGSEQNFVHMMNEKAGELNLLDTHYVNCTGLPNDSAYSSAYDQSIVLNKVLDYDLYHTYSSIWMEDFLHPSGRKTQMANTNKLSRFYDGCIGGKTGFTNQAKSCLAVGAKRNDTSFIAVVLGADSSKERFALASDLLNYGFNNFTSKTILSNTDLTNKEIKIKGSNQTAKLKVEREYTIITDKNAEINYSLNFNLPDMMTSVKENEVVGFVEVVVDGVVQDKINILSTNTINEATLWDYIKEITK